jgi:hypothetical protein
MADDRGPADRGDADALADLSQKLDTVAGAVAAIAATHIDLLAQVVEAEGRRAEDAIDVGERLDALERQITEVRDHLTLHVDTGLAAVLRLIDDRLVALRTTLEARS